MTENIQRLADLAGRRVGVIKGGPVPEWLGKVERGPILVPYPRLQDEMFGLLLGEVDAIPPFEDSAWKLAERAGVADQLKVVGEPYTEAKRAIAVRRDLPGLRDRLDAAVADLLNSPEYQVSSPHGMPNRRPSGLPRARLGLPPHRWLCCCWACCCYSRSRPTLRADSAVRDEKSATLAASCAARSREPAL